MSGTKLTPVDAGKRGAERRWGPPRRFNIGDLTPAQRELVAGLIEAQRLANAAARDRVPMGFTREQAAKMSTDVVGLSGALAQWSGGQKSSAEVADILSKAMLGERDGLKALGIAISEADVQARLAANGTDKLKGAALEQAKAVATQQLIFEKSADAQAAYAKSSETLAGKTALLGAKWSEFTESIVAAAVPALHQVMGFIMDTAIPAVSGFAAGIQPAIDAVVGFATALTGGGGGGGIQGALAGIQGPIIGFVEQGVTALMSFGTRAVEAFTGALPGLIAGVSGLFQGAFDWIVNEGVPMAAEAIGPLALKFIDWIGETVPKLVAALPQIGGAVIDFLARNLPVLIGKLAEWGGAFIGWVAANVLPRLPDALATIAGAILGWIAGVIPKVAGEALKLGSEFVANVMAGVGTLVAKFAEAFGAFLAGLPSWGAKIASAALELGGKFVSGFIAALASLPGKVADAVANAFRQLKVDVGPFHISGGGITIDLPRVELPSFATGAWKLPQDTLASVHKGEMIIPADIAARLRGETSAPVATAAVGGRTTSGATRVTIGSGAIVVNGVNDPEEIARRIVQPLRRELTRQGMSLA